MAANLNIKLLRLCRQAIDDYEMILPGENILIAFSGGKDSFSLFHLLFRTFFENDSFGDVPIFYPVHIDLGFPSNTGEQKIDQVKDYMRRHGSILHIEETNIFQQSHLPQNKKNPCFLCSRMRRKKMYESAIRLNCSKIALAHHKDDIIETFLLNVFFSREISTMTPKQMTFKGQFHIIRPLAYIEEKLLRQYAWKNKFPVIDNQCPEEGKSKRKLVKDLLYQLEKEEPLIRHNIFHALKNVKPEFLL